MCGRHEQHSPLQTHPFVTHTVSALLQSLFLLLTGGPGLGLWGASTSSAMRPDAWTYLSIRGLGAPFTVVLLVLQANLFSFCLLLMSHNDIIIATVHRFSLGFSCC